jgi:hypothetical protein
VAGRRYPETEWTQNLGFTNTAATVFNKDALGFLENRAMIRREQFDRDFPQ